MLGFDTIGNATVIAYDGNPVIATDPWICGHPYFGSWTMSHDIPIEQMENIRRCKYVWFSHGHPDHLNSESLERLTGRTVLLPDHVGGRIAADLHANKLNVQILRDAEWTPLSPNIRVLSLSDYNQDGVLLLQIGKTLVINLNDGSARGWKRFIRQIARTFDDTYILALKCYGDADMINLYDENGKFILPRAAAKRPLGPEYTRLLRDYGVRNTLPFSCFHRYQRSDSIHIGAFETPLEAHSVNFDDRWGNLLPAFVRVDLTSHDVKSLNPTPRAVSALDPLDFGDDWSEPLSQNELGEADRYFRRKEQLTRHLGFIGLRVGGREHRIVLNQGLKKTGITFEVPKNSFMTAIRYQVFDDLLIGNFMKTTLHNMPNLYPRFCPVVPKYADNGKAETRDELAEYFEAYRKRAGFNFLLERGQHHAEDIFRSFASPHSWAFKLVRRLVKES
jgi:hypothetical protein